MIFYSPANLDLEARLPDGERKWIRYYRAFIDLLYRLPPEDAGWVRIKQAYLRNLIPQQRIETILPWLIGEGIVQQHRQYIPGILARKYRLRRQYRRAAFEKLTVPEKYAAKLNRIAKEFGIIIPPGDHYRKLYKWLQALTIDGDAALSYVASLPLDDQTNRDPAVCNLIERRLTFRPDAFGLRLHTNISFLAEDLRQFLRIDGQPLVNVDISCSQPYFLAAYLKYLHSGGVSSFFPSFCVPFVSPGYDEDFVETALAGTLYEKIQKCAGLDSRKAAKDAVFAAMFARNKPFLTKEERAFAAAFPKTFAACREIKRGDHRNLAQLLQRTESRLILEGVCMEIVRARPEIPIYTIHDSIMTVEKYAEFVKQTIILLASTLGLVPRVNITSYPSQLNASQAA
jgi:hypothetical protein